jgi:hypothetical protein
MTKNINPVAKLREMTTGSVGFLRTRNEATALIPSDVRTRGPERIDAPLYSQVRI